MQYEMRVKNHLLKMSDQKFDQIAELIDPDDLQQTAFFELYYEIQNERNEQPEGKAKCVIF